MKKVFQITFLFFLICSFSFAQTNTQTEAQKLGFPYDINFSAAEIKYIKSLSPASRQKLIDAAKASRNKKQNATTTESGSTLLGGGTPGTGAQQPNNQANPYLNPTSAQQQANPFMPTQSPYSSGQYSNNPYLNNSQVTTPTSQNNASGINQNTDYKPLTAEDMKNLPKLGNPNADCSNFGTYGISIANVDARVRMDTNKLCIVFGRKIKIASGFRAGACSSGNQHACAKAIDPNVKDIGDQKMQALLTLAFICNGYNVGSYEPNFPAHFDIEQSGRWKTWSRWAHTNGKAPLPYEPYIQDALNMMGVPYKSAQSYAAGGRHTKAQMAQKAKSVLDGLNLGSMCQPEGKV